MEIKIFGKLIDIFHTDTYRIDAKASSIYQLKKHLESTFPLLKESTYLVVVNNENTNDSDTISEENEIALLPPYSGG